MNIDSIDEPFLRNFQDNNNKKKIKRERERSLCSSPTEATLDSNKSTSR